MNRTAGLLCAVVWTCGACNWISLATHSLNYRTTQRGEPGNVVARGSFVYATLAEDGLAVIDGTTGQRLSTVAPPADQSIDDLAISGAFLFALDARPPGHLSVYSLADPDDPRLLGPPREVAVGPFSGVSAAEGLCVVSGGTSHLTLWRYDSGGTLAGPFATADFGRGQPDVLLGPRGVLYVSTHYWGPYFGLDIARFDAAESRIELMGKLSIPGAGFTTGGARPANFPIESALLGIDTLLVATARGLDVIDVRTPAEPRLITTLDVGGPAVNVDVDHRTAGVVVGGEAPALVFLDFATNSPTQRRVALIPGTIPTGVALGGPRAAVAAGSTGVVLFTK